MRSNNLSVKSNWEWLTVLFILAILARIATSWLTNLQSLPVQNPSGIDFLLTGLAQLGNVVAGIFAFFLIDRVNLKKASFSILAFLGLITLGSIAINSSYLAAIVEFCGQGLSYIVQIVVLLLIAEKVPSKRRGLAIGLVVCASYLASLVPVTSESDLLGFDIRFIPAAVGILVILFSFWILKLQNEAGESSDAKGTHSVETYPIIPLMFLGVIYAFGFYVVLLALNQEKSLSVDAFFPLLRSLGPGLIALILGLLTDRIGPSRTLLMMLPLSLGACLFLTLTPSFDWIAILIVAAYRTPFLYIAIHSAQRRNRGRIIALAFFAVGFGSFLVGLIANLLEQGRSADISILALTAAIANIVAASIVFFTSKRTIAELSRT